MQWIGSAKMDIVGQRCRLPMQLRLELQSRTAAGAALSTGPMEITNLGCREAVDVVIGVEMLVGGFEDGTDIKAVGGKDAVVMLGGADFVTAGSKSIGGTGGNRTLNSGCCGCFRASKPHRFRH
uniref:Uncharacterized protein n=1 Tax=Romanomermis culicivorax TaxID=13658 RepID=A0A915IMH0_ROMCU